jgi:GxxExxY protein
MHIVPPSDDRETYAIIGAAMTVHSALGCGFLEAVYRAALAIELNACCIPFTSEVRLPITYRGTVLPLHYRVDFICYGSVLVEVKAAETLTSVDQAQVINYLKASSHERGLLINFGARSLQHKRVVHSTER